jgi:hypothetical protein
MRSPTPIVRFGPPEPNTAPWKSWLWAIAHNQDNGGGMDGGPGWRGGRGTAACDVTRQRGEQGSLRGRGGRLGLFRCPAGPAAFSDRVAAPPHRCWPLFVLGVAAQSRSWAEARTILGLAAGFAVLGVLAYWTARGPRRAKRTPLRTSTEAVRSVTMLFVFGQTRPVRIIANASSPVGPLQKRRGAHP